MRATALIRRRASPSVTLKVYETAGNLKFTASEYPTSRNYVKRISASSPRGFDEAGMPRGHARR